MALEGGDVLKTLVVVHPSHSGTEEHCTALRTSLIGAGFVVIREESRDVSRDTAVKLAADNAAASDVQRLVGKCRLYALARVDATNALNDFFAANATHAAAATWPVDADGASARLLALFPRITVDPIPSNVAARDYVDTHLKAVLVKGLTAAAKTKPENPVKFLAEYLLDNNPNKPGVVDI
jgi:hypothetical protein